MLSRPTSALVPTPLKSISKVEQPSTPKSISSKITSANVTPSPGSFRHPRMTEIIERQSATSFTSKNVQLALLNTAALVGSFAFGSTIISLITTPLSYASVDVYYLYPTIVLWALRVVFMLNTILALRQKIPLISKKDILGDITLTPTQRALMGLPPSQKSADMAGIITPPRYRRSSSSLSGTPQAYSTDRRSVSANYSSSPLSTSRHTIGFSPSPQNPTSSRRASGSPFSPGSPLLHRALTSTSARSELMNFNDSVQSGFETSTNSGTLANRGLQRSQSLKEKSKRSQEPNTPSPGSKRQPGLNYKWLYEKGYKMPLDGNFAY